GVAGLAAADLVPVAVADAGRRQAVARPGRGAQVLHAAGDVVGCLVIDVDVVELADGQRRRVPGLAAAGGDVHAAVVAADHAPRVRRVDPQVVVVAVVKPLDLLEGLAAVDAP